MNYKHDLWTMRRHKSAWYEGVLFFEGDTYMCRCIDRQIELMQKVWKRRKTVRRFEWGEPILLREIEPFDQVWDAMVEAKSMGQFPKSRAAQGYTMAKREGLWFISLDGEEVFRFFNAPKRYAIAATHLHSHAGIWPEDQPGYMSASNQVTYFTHAFRELVDEIDGKE